MKHRFFYGIKPSINKLKAEDFSPGEYECTLLLQNKTGTPVTVS